MLNIEIHGVGPVFLAGLIQAIQEQLIGTDFERKTIVTECGDSCEDLNENKKSFLRICFSYPEPIARLVELLKPLKLDIETVQLDNFFPAEK